MYYFQNFSIPVIVYTALHGSYGIIWIFKDMLMPDKSFQEHFSLTGVFATSTALILYWTPYFVLVSGNSETYIKDIGLDRLFIAILMYNIGVFLMIGTDVQKTTALKYFTE